MRLFVTAAVVATAGLLTVGVGVAAADEIEVDGNYSSAEGCNADGPNVEITHNDHLYNHWDCRYGPDGFWHVWLSS